MLETQIKKYKLGVIAPRSAKLESIIDVLTPKKANIGHIYTNDAEDGGHHVITFCLSEKIPFTVYPIRHIAGGVMPSNAAIIKSTDFVYILDEGQSGNTKLAERECEKQNRKYKIVKI